MGLEVLVVLEVEGGERTNRHIGHAHQQRSPRSCYEFLHQIESPLSPGRFSGTSRSFSENQEVAPRMALSASTDRRSVSTNLAACCRTSLRPSGLALCGDRSVSRGFHASKTRRVCSSASPESRIAISASPCLAWWSHAKTSDCSTTKRPVHSEISAPTSSDERILIARLFSMELDGVSSSSGGSHSSGIPSSHPQFGGSDTPLLSSPVMLKEPLCRALRGLRKPFDSAGLEYVHAVGYTTLPAGGVWRVRTFGRPTELPFDICQGTLNSR